MSNDPKTAEAAALSTSETPKQEQAAKKDRPVRMVMKYRDEVVLSAGKMTHESYKQIKHMSKYQLVAFMMQVSAQGFKAGYDAAKKELALAEKETASEPESAVAAEDT